MVCHQIGTEQDAANARLSNEPARSEKAWPNYLEALELINGAGEAMTAMEDHSRKVQAKAFELMQKAKADQLSAGHEIAALQQKLAACETRAAELDSLLAEAELRAQTTQEWLQRFLEAINGAFSAHRAELSKQVSKARMDPAS